MQTVARECDAALAVVGSAAAGANRGGGCPNRVRRVPRARVRLLGTAATTGLRGTRLAAPAPNT